LLHYNKKHSNLIAKSIISLMVVATGYLINYGGNLFLARWLMAADYGDYSVAIGAITVCSSLSLLGSD